jgi:hypothetical protein
MIEFANDPVLMPLNPINILPRDSCKGNCSIFLMRVWLDLQRGFVTSGLRTKTLKITSEELNDL